MGILSVTKISIRVSIAEQKMRLFDNQTAVRCYSISTAKNGSGELKNSDMTPRGRHIIRAKIGANCPINTVFIHRRPTGEIFSSALQQANPNRDWILTRILWLSGCEIGKNRLGLVDTMARYIYIHGCPDDVAMGIPQSHGCVRMRNIELIEFFDLAPVGAEVMIEE